jgi:vanillate O-demethylase monooxygenase subunit
LLQHWHPIILSRKVGRKPVSVTLCGEQLVVFRTGQGKLGAFFDRCIHRGMRLSQGWIKDDRLVCPYHGWSYDCNGQVQSPSTPSLQACAIVLDAVEYQGAIWLRKKGPENPAVDAASDPTIVSTKPSLPDFEVEGYQSICMESFDIQVPLELVLDNFAEMEHTPTTHQFFGHETLSAAQMQVELYSNTIRVYNQGPQRSVSRLAHWLFGLSPGDELLVDWHFHFSPVYSVAQSCWKNPQSGELRPDWKIKIPTFFVPINDKTTRLILFVFGQSTVSPFIFHTLVKPLVRLTTLYETWLDQRMLEKIADQQMTLEKMQLGRLDKALIECRKYLDRFYLN